LRDLLHRKIECGNSAQIKNRWRVEEKEEETREEVDIRNGYMKIFDLTN